MSAPPGVLPELADLSWELPYTFLGLDEVGGAFETSAAVVLPVPYESTTSWGSGTRREPRAIIESSRYVDLHDQEFNCEPGSVLGVRMALGAERGPVLGMVLREGALLAGGALLLGGVTAATLSRFLVGLLYEVEAADPATYAGVGVILAMAALLAAYVPAKRATRVDPIEALRS